MRSYSRAEMETSILWDEEERIAHIYTGNPTVKRKLDKLCERFPDVYKPIQWEHPEDGAMYDVPKKYIRFGTPRTMTDEQKAAAGERMAKYHEERAELLEKNEE